MGTVRRAFLLATAERYAVTLLSLLSLPILARLLEPAEFGIAVLAGIVITLVDPLRDFGTGSYIIQERELSQQKLRSAFSLNLAMTAVLGAAIWLAAPRIGAFYDKPLLVDYIRVGLLGFLLGPFISPLLALLRRDLAFGSIALVTVPTTVLYTVLAITLAATGFGAMSLAYATLASVVASLVLCLHRVRRFDIFRIETSDIASVVRYGVYETPAGMLERMWESLPFFTLGRLGGTEAVGLYQRASLVCTLPERLLLSSVASVMLPAAAAAARDGGDLGKGFLKALAIMSVVQWSSLLCIALLAHPATLILLGPRWLETVPIIQILALVMLFNIPNGLVYPILAAVGNVRLGALLYAIFVPVGTVLFVAAGQFGVLPAVATLAITFLLRTTVSLVFVRRHAHYEWRALATLTASAWTALAAALPPTTIVLLQGTTQLSVFWGMTAGVLAMAGFLYGLWRSRHPLWEEALPLLHAIKAAIETRTDATSPRAGGLIASVIRRSPRGSG